MFKHFLVTRFNLRVENWKTTKNGDTVLSEAWLIDRFRLFETYCLPSVKNQTNQNFTWLVFFDIYTPENFKDKIQQLAKEYSNFHPVFIDGNKVFNQSIVNRVQASISNKDEFVITTRMDNDDLIHKDFINTIQSLFKPVNKHVIDLRIGYQLIVEKNRGEIVFHSNDFNPFISLVEKTDDITSVFSREHKHWKDATSATIYKEKEMWMAVIHKNNKLNIKNNKSKSIYAIDTMDFGLAKDKIILKNALNVFLSNLQVDLRSFLGTCKRKIENGLRPSRSRGKVATTGSETV